MRVSLLILVGLSLGAATDRAPFNLTVVVSPDGVVSCEALGSPSPAIVWSPRGDGPILRTNETGIYVCEARNAHGTATAILYQRLDPAECSRCDGFAWAAGLLGVLLASLLFCVYRWDRRGKRAPGRDREAMLVGGSVWGEK